MTTEVTIKLTQDKNHNDILVETVNTDGGSILEDARVSDGEEKNFYVHSGQYLVVNEVEKLPVEIAENTEGIEGTDSIQTEVVSESAEDPQPKSTDLGPITGSIELKAEDPDASAESGDAGDLAAELDGTSPNAPAREDDTATDDGEAA